MLRSLAWTKHVVFSPGQARKAVTANLREMAGFYERVFGTFFLLSCVQMTASIHVLVLDFEKGAHLVLRAYLRHIWSRWLHSESRIAASLSSSLLRSRL